MKFRISTKLLLVLLLTALVPLLIAGFMSYRTTLRVADIAAQANAEIASLAMSDSTEALSIEKEIDLQARTQSLAEDINDILVWVEADTAELAAYASFLYSHSDSFGRYPNPSVYGNGENGTFASLEPNNNSWLMVSALGAPNGEVSDTLMEEILLLEFMDIKFRSIAENNPYAIQLYLNTESQITRGMPFIDGEYIWMDAAAQFPSDMDLSSFDFYFLADATHNPQRETVWTELYWDPAGLGWMVSSIAPVYQEDELKGVVGIDITLGTIIDDIINVQIESTGFAFLMSENGQAIAFPERAADFLGFSGSLEGDFGYNENFSFFLTERQDEAFVDIIDEMRSGASGLTYYPGEQEHLFAYHPVELTNWSVGVVAPTKEVIAPALETNDQIEQNMEQASLEISERSSEFVSTTLFILVALVGTIIPVALLFSRTISRPIYKLKEGSRKIGEGDLTHRISVRSGDEIEDLAQSFNQMSDDLQNKINEIETANAELKKLDALKSQFISMASHELRTPLIAIKGYVDLLREGEAGEVNAEQMTMLKTISRNTQRLARIVTELLDLSRIEANRLPLRIESFDAKTLIEEIAAEQKPAFQQRRQTLTLSLSDNLPLLHADRDRISQVLVNLLGNAIKYTPDGGRIEISAYPEDNGVHLSVSDSGIGIAEEHLDKIFSRFYTAGDVHKHKTGKNDFLSGGTGLGLSIVEGIVKAHNGRIWAESQPNEGATFHVTLPAALHSDEVSPPPEIYKTIAFSESRMGVSDSKTAASPTKILIIDDEPDTLAVTSRMLNEEYDVVNAHTSGTGLKTAMSNVPDVILLDAWMPGLSGYDVCRTLKTNARTQHIPIIMFTAAVQQEEAERAREAGADALITKPFQKGDLLQLIEEFQHG